MANKYRYKRSWKNYLLDANYQLRFTLTMVAVAAGLMAPLGWWVSEKAARATEVALNEIDGIRCPEILSAAATAAAPAASDENVIVEDLLDESADPTSSPPPPEEPDVEEPSAAEEGSGAAEDVDEGERPRALIKVDIDDSEMPDAPVVVVGEMRNDPATAEQIAESKVARERCLKHIKARKSSVRDRKSLIRTVMVVSGIFLLLGLGAYGIKTTHRVAGPLFKVGLYLAKLEKNVYDTVYNLRKGDQLVEFYDHFKAAHAGVTKMQEEDRDRLREAIALAKDAGLVEKDAELASLVTELERLLAEKEESLANDEA